MTGRRAALPFLPLRDLALLAVTASLVLAPGRASAQTARLVDIASPANCTLPGGGACDPFSFADSEPSIAVNPANPEEIAIVAFSGAWGPTQNAPVWKSRDGGVTWTKVFQIPQPTTTGGPGDQKIAFDRDGTLFIAELQLGATPRNFVFRQDGAPDAALTPGQVYGDDQPHLEVDATADSPCAGDIYSPWLNFAPQRQRSMVSASDDDGVAMTDVAAGDNSDFDNRTTRIALASDGTAYVVYKTRQGDRDGRFEDAQFRVQRSDDCGATWDGLGPSGVSVHGSGTVRTWFTITDDLDNGFGNHDKGPVARARSSDAWIAADPSDGDVYVAYVDRDRTDKAQIYVARSTDRGLTWTRARVSRGAHHSGYPEIAVAANGTVGVLYIDYDDSGPATIFRHRFARSVTDGATWGDQVLQSMDPNDLSNGADGFLWGDYEGLTALGDSFYGVFTGESIGRPTPELDPIFFEETALAGELSVRMIIEPPGDPGAFNVRVDGRVERARAPSGSLTRVLLGTGAHTVSQTTSFGTDPTDYVTVIAGDCAADGSVTLAAREVKRCTITNLARSSLAACREHCEDDRNLCLSEPDITPPSVCIQIFRACLDTVCPQLDVPPRLTVRKVLLPSSDRGRFNLRIDGVTRAANVGDGGSTGARVLDIGVHQVAETAGVGTDLADYERTIGGDCAADGSVALAAGQSKTCTITNAAPPGLTVRLRVVPPGDPGRFNLRIDGVTRAGNVGDGGSTGPREVSPGTHTVSQTAGSGTRLADYRTFIGGDCAANGRVTTAVGEAKTCLITNLAEGGQECEDQCREERSLCLQDPFILPQICIQIFNACRDTCN